MNNVENQKDQKDEDEEEVPVNFNVCYLCQQPLPPKSNGKERARQKKCVSCLNRQAQKKLRKNPVELLYYKWRNAKNRKGSDIASLVSRETVEAVYTRAGKRSELSGESDYTRLCISSKTKQPRTQEDLVLITSGEALALAKKRTDEERALLFDALKLKNTTQ